MYKTSIQFKYSDDVHMVALGTNTSWDATMFVPLLGEIARKSQGTFSSRGWGYVVARMVGLLIEEKVHNIAFIEESLIADKLWLDKYIITIDNDAYTPIPINQIDNRRLIDYLMIEVDTPNFKCKDSVKVAIQQIEKESKNYTIQATKQKIVELQEKLHILQKGEV